MLVSAFDGSIKIALAEADTSSSSPRLMTLKYARRLRRVIVTAPEILSLSKRAVTLWRDIAISHLFARKSEISAAENPSKRGSDFASTRKAVEKTN
jgi:hypothetical protein